MLQNVKKALQEAGAFVPDCSDEEFLTMKLSAFKMDSLEFLQFLLALQELTQKEISDDSVSNAMTIAEFIDAVS